MTTSREIKSALTKAFKGVKFSVTTRNVCCETVTVEWTGGPFIDEVKTITNEWNTFEDHSDIMSDFHSYRGTEIKFKRNLTHDEMEFLSANVVNLGGKVSSGYELYFCPDYECFRIVGDSDFNHRHIPEKHNKAVKNWKQNGLAVSLDESPQVIEAIREAHKKEIENARKEREEKRGELIQGDYDGTPADDNLDHIVIHWHEGFEFIAQDAKFKSFKSAHDAIVKCCEFHTDTNVGKMAFSVVFRDGEVYEGRLYLSPNEDNYLATDNVIGKHCVKFLEHCKNKGLQYTANKEAIDVDKYLEKHRFEDVTPADDVIITDSKVVSLFQSSGRVKRNVTSNNNAIAAEWLLDDDHRENVLMIAKTEKVESVELHTMFTDSATAKINESKESLLEKYSQWVAKKIALGQANKIIAFDDWQDIHTA